MSTVDSTGTSTNSSGRPPASPVAPWVRLPRLELILNSSLANITWEVLTGLVDRRISEDLTLEFKRDVYGNAERDKQELCKDVASLANAAGGLVIIGLGEDQDGRADQLVPFTDADSHARRLTETLIKGVFPWISDLSMWLVEAPEGDASVLCILVPPSDEAPHGVRRNDAFAWPTRQDQQTRWMREPEIASRYRERFRLNEDAHSRVDAVDSEGLEHLKRLDSCWLSIALTPTRGGRLPADRETFRTWLTEAVGPLPTGLSTQTAVLGRRRIVFTDRWSYRGQSEDQHVELHDDGSGFGALVVTERRPITDIGRLNLPDHVVFSTDSVLSSALSLTHILAAHAANAGAGGELLVRARLVPGTMVTVDPQPRPVSLIPSEPFNIGGSGSLGERIVPGAMPVLEPSPLDLAMPLSVVTSPGDLVAAVAELTHELFGEFASVPTDQVFTRDGLVLDRRPAGALGPLLGWARVNGVLSPGV